MATGKSKPGSKKTTLPDKLNKIGKKKKMNKIKNHVSRGRETTANIKEKK